MMKQYDVYIQSLEKMKEQIENYPLEISEGTKKMQKEYHVDAVNQRNEYIFKQISKLEKDLEQVKSFLMYKTEQLLPRLHSENEDIQLHKLQSLDNRFVYYNVYADFFSKLGFDQIFSGMSHYDQLDFDVILSYLCQIINTFQLAGISLSSKDFSYSNYVREFMCSFFVHYKNDDFQDKMKDIFDHIYWNCPNLIIHLKINIYIICFKYQKKLNLYCTKKFDEFSKEYQNDSYSFISQYEKMRKEIEVSRLTDSYYIVQKFVNNDYNIDDFLETSDVWKQKFNQFLNDCNYDDMTDEERDDYFRELIQLKYMLYELDNIKKYEELKKDIIKRFSSTEKNIIKNKWKEIKKIEAAKNKLLKKYYSLINKDNYNKYREKISFLISEINEKINVLDLLYIELEDLRITEKIKHNLSNGSTIYDAFCLVDSCYGYLKQFFETKMEIKDSDQLNYILNEFHNFIYSGSLVILKNVNIFQECSIVDMINHKCKLFHINVNIQLEDNLDGLKKDLEFIEFLYYVRNCDLSIPEIKFICEVKTLG